MQIINMKKYSVKLVRSPKGFTLVEVMIGMMILVMAIVTATSLLINIMNSNRMVADHLKAYYLAQEGVEAVRNMRDTRWLNNKDWLNGGIYNEFEISDSAFPVFYSVNLKREGWASSVGISLEGDITRLGDYLPWDFTKQSVSVVSSDADAVLDKDEFIVKDLNDVPLYPEFHRYIKFEKYESTECNKKAEPEKTSCNDNFRLVKFVVVWRDLGRVYNVTLEEVLSNWKGGAL